MKTVKFWKWLSVLLLLCNIGLLVILFMRPPHPHGGPHKVDSFIIDELELNDEQQKKFLSLKKEHRSKIESLLKEGRQLRNAYFSELKKDLPDDSIINARSLAIANNQQAIEMATFNHFRSLREICTDVQKAAFDKIILEVLKRMAPPPPPPAPPSPGLPLPPPPPEAPPLPK